MPKPKHEGYGHYMKYPPEGLEKLDLVHAELPPEEMAEGVDRRHREEVEIPEADIRIPDEVPAFDNACGIDIIEKLQREYRLPDIEFDDYYHDIRIDIPHCEGIMCHSNHTDDAGDAIEDIGQVQCPAEEVEGRNYNNTDKPGNKGHISPDNLRRVMQVVVQQVSEDRY